MNTIEGFFNRAKAVAGVAGKKTEEMLETSKLKLQVVQLNADIDKIYKRIGELMYSQSRNHVNAENEINEAMDQLDRLYDNVAELNAQISAMQNTVKCTNCGATNSTDAIFCSRCGRTMNKDFSTAEACAEQPYVDIDYKEN